MSYKETVKTYFEKAEKNGYDLPKVRRIIEDRFRKTLIEDEEKFKLAAYATLKTLGVELRGKNEHF